MNERQQNARDLAGGRMENYKVVENVHSGQKETESEKESRSRRRKRAEALAACLRLLDVSVVRDPTRVVSGARQAAANQRAVWAGWAIAGVQHASHLTGRWHKSDASQLCNAEA